MTLAALVFDYRLSGRAETAVITRAVAAQQFLHQVAARHRLSPSTARLGETDPALASPPLSACYRDAVRRSWLSLPLLCLRCTPSRSPYALAMRPQASRRGGCYRQSLDELKGTNSPIGPLSWHSSAPSSIICHASCVSSVPPARDRHHTS